MKNALDIRKTANHIKRISMRFPIVYYHWKSNLKGQPELLLKIIFLYLFVKSLVVIIKSYLTESNNFRMR